MLARYAACLFTASLLISNATSAETRISRGFVPLQDGIEITEIVGGLEFLWGVAALPDGAFLITERDGTIRT